MLCSVDLPAEALAIPVLGVTAKLRITVTDRDSAGPHCGPHCGRSSG